ncbi:MAG TPA: LLM class flavin-dependent oxidoreductase [Gaiellaceae bacterium]|nr:LLM class flavin-dependent oxidoreductase [Gaiellaceae bacterium]
MRVGVLVPQAPEDRAGRMPSWTDVVAFAEHAEAVGLDSLWVCDHFVSSIPGTPFDGIHEGWTILSALAARTSRVELGTLVMCTGYRSPGLLAKMAATLDEVSGGRFLLGVGAGWHESEYEAFGYSTDRRVDKFEEAVQIIAPLLRGETVTFAGGHYWTDQAVLLPSPKRRIPVLVGAKGLRMLGLTARHADAWNTAWFARPDDELRRRLDVLESALDAEGRDPATLRRTVGMHIERALETPPEQHASALDAFEALGFDDAIVVLEPMTSSSLDRLAEAVRLRGR